VLTRPLVSTCQLRAFDRGTSGGGDNKDHKCPDCGAPMVSISKLQIGARFFECKVCKMYYKSETRLYQPNSQPQETNEAGLAEGKTFTEIPTPKEFHAYLDRFVIGQEPAKMELSTAVHYHYKRIQNNLQYKANQEEKKQAAEGEMASVLIDKSNILIMGPTGSGKTHLVQTLAKYLDVPYAVADCTALTQAGYVGEDIESVIQKLLQNAGGNVEKAQRGIVYLDEIDKIAARKLSGGNFRDVSGEGVQQGLLKLLEGSVVSVKDPFKKPGAGNIQVDTSDILFICSGAFTGLPKLIQNRMQKKSLGFTTKPQTVSLTKKSKIAAMEERHKEEDECMLRIEPEDLHKFGLIPEFVGRLQVLVPIMNLTQNDFVRILNEPDNAIVKQYRSLLAPVELEMTDEAFERIAQIAIERGTGARGLNSSMHNLLKSVKYEIPGSDITSVYIDADVVDKKKEPVLTRRELEIEEDQAASA